MPPNSIMTPLKARCCPTRLSLLLLLIAAFTG
ncbi:Uncharacterized protein Vi05172_g11619 [Venturia inaequalis]|nr:Uncharacterized protein Vi05172_g11619 [Venturia inaequalis]